MATWIIIKIIYTISNYLRKNIEPEISQFITIKLLRSIFRKYEEESEIGNVAIILNKIFLIKSTFQDLMYIICSVFIPRTIVLFVSCFSLYSIHPSIGIVTFLCILFHVFVYAINYDKCMEPTCIEIDSKDELYDYVEDIFYNINIVETIPDGFNNELDNIIDVTKISKQKEKNSLDCIHEQQNSGYFINLFSGALILFVIFQIYVTKQIGSKEASRSILYLTGLFENIYEICYYIPEMTQRFGVFKNNEVFLKKLLVKKNRDVQFDNFDPTNVNIRFEDLSFGYEPDHLIFDGFSCEIPKEKIITFFGKSGSGKTTLMKLLFQNISPNRGRILIGNQDISKYEISEIRQYLAYVGQNTTSLFNFSIYENIIYGYKNTPELRQEIENLFAQFHLLEIFSNLIDKNNSNIFSFFNEKAGKHGRFLSGGQKQVIHLLRLKLNSKNKIIILDEPTSALDTISRNYIIEYLKYMNSLGKTIIIITHDEYLKTISNHVLYFSNGQNPKLI